MVEIFKTSVNSKRQANKLLKSLSARLPAYHFNFDLDDRDRILRAQSNGASVEITRVIEIVKGHSIDICLLDD